ncbi:MAG: translation elongation factor Ts [Candidatus Sericytochromatia bacterium]|nr:translation elongation factor Ts [Candidatus Sericytochromatia bacterium]
MAEISAALVKELREKTNVGMMDCKKALTETNGDLEAAIDLLRKKGMAKAAAKGSRIATEGLVSAYVAADGRTGGIVEVNCETDFVGRNETFVELVGAVAQFVVDRAGKANGSGADLLELPGWEAGKTVDESIKEAIQKTGEKIDIRRFERYEGAAGATLGCYIHLGGKIGVLVELQGGDAALAKDVAMHVAASQPQFIKREDVSSEVVEKEREILLAQPDLQSKPENVRAKMVEGRIGKFFEQICLVEQPFVKDPALTVKDLLGKADASVTRFVRFGLGEGLEKKQENFAEEVASYMKA